MNMEKLKRFLTGRKLLVAAATVIVDILVGYIPSLAEIQSELVKVVTAVGIALILAIAGEDMSYWHGAASKKDAP